MKLTIDTESKTIQIDESVNAKELFEQLLNWEIDLDEYSMVTSTATITYTPVTYPTYIGT